MSERRLAELHIMRAREEAFRIFAFSGAVYPEEWGASYIEEIVSHLFDFAFHARRVNQLCGLNSVDFGNISTFVVRISENDPGNWEGNYHYALNRLSHVAEFTFGNAHADHRKIFTSSKANLIPLYVKVRTDRHEVASISLNGLAFCFLTRVIPKIKEMFPDYRF